MPSDWYPEKSWAAAIKERKQTKQTISMARGQKFKTKSREAIIPTQHNAMSIPDPLESQSSEGAYQRCGYDIVELDIAWR